MRFLAMRSFPRLLRWGGCGALIYKWSVDRAQVAFLAHEARGGRSPTLADVVLRGGGSKDDTVRRRKNWQVVAHLRNKEGRPAKAEVCFPV